MSDVITPFVRHSLLRASIDIGDETRYDHKLREIIAEANQDIDARIKPYTAETPLDPGGVIHGQLAKAGLHNARRLWFNHIRQHQLEEAERVQYEAKMEVLIASLIADRGTRQKAVLAVADPAGRRLFLPAQKDTFILDGPLG